MKTYEDGLNEAWEAARKVVCDEGYNYTELERIFGKKSPSRILETLTASEAIAKIEEYEEKQKAPVFKTGDRVLVKQTRCYPNGEIAITEGTYAIVTQVPPLAGGEYTIRTDHEYCKCPSNYLELANDVLLIGDEVYLLDASYRGVVTAVWDDCGVVKTERLTQSDKLACDDAKDLHRTGRRFPEIVDVLKQMQEGNE